MSAALTGRVAVVTGASSGIGAASARRLAAAGATVVAVARRGDRLTELVADVERAGGKAVALEADVTDTESLYRAADRVHAELGPADLVFANAGVMLPAPVEELPRHQWQHQIDVNVTALTHTMGAFVPHLVEVAEQGRVADLVTTSSIAAENIFPNFAVYAGSKAYTTQLARTLRAELGGKGIRVSALEPGLVATELQGHVTDQDALDWLADARRSTTWLEPDDVAAVVEFLAGLPAHVNLQRVTVMPTGQPS
ncbi:SDR family oxidoreductase [Actinokineospora inagensis]|uniref:SDR family oxidoreductase n=1 Tax=Actinokineospora inagensis TaxID=103730 RepID=UPI000427D2F6|nr:SDR family oxidoreductase [Actinokineospora inagensis]